LSRRLSITPTALILVKSIPLYSESGIFSFRSPQDSSEGIRQRAKARIEEQKIKI